MPRIANWMNCLTQPPSRQHYDTRINGCLASDSEYPIQLWRMPRRAALASGSLRQIAYPTKVGTKDVDDVPRLGRPHPPHRPDLVGDDVDHPGPGVSGHEGH